MHIRKKIYVFSLFLTLSTSSFSEDADESAKLELGVNIFVDTVMPVLCSTGSFRSCYERISVADCLSQSMPVKQHCIGPISKDLVEIDKVIEQDLWAEVNETATSSKNKCISSVFVDAYGLTRDEVDKFLNIECDVTKY